MMDSVAARPIETCPNCSTSLLGSHLRRVYQQKWAMTVLKAMVLFACETLLFFAVNIGEFVIAYTFV